jgi:exonuclease III
VVLGRVHVAGRRLNNITTCGPVLNVLVFSLHVTVWNVNGNLALKIRDDNFVRFITGSDVIFLQETWLRPSQDDTLPLPEGYHLVARSRPDDKTFGRQWGGTVALIRDDIPHSVVTVISAPDLLVLNLSFCFLISAYLPPSGSYWSAWSDVDPEQRLQEALAYCCASQDNMVLLLGDLNARTASKSSRSSRSVRLSSDSACNSRGNRLLQWCSTNHLSILNGTTAERDSPGALTSFQELGASVVDYVIGSAAHATWIHDHDMTVENGLWSDHSKLSVKLTLPSGVLCPERAGVLLPPRPRLPTRERSYLDGLVDAVVHQAGDHTVDRLYGLATDHSNPYTVYVAVACSNVGKVTARTTFAQYWGVNHASNEVLLVPGVQNEGRGSIAALVHVLQTSPPSQTLLLYTASQYAIRAFVYGAPGNSARGWQCPNSDLLRVGVALLQQRTAAVHLRWLSESSRRYNDHYDSARYLALRGLRSETVVAWILPHMPLPSVQTRGSLSSLSTSTSKVDCNLPHHQPQLPKPQVLVSESDLAMGLERSMHRGRTRERTIQAENLTKLLNAQSAREWWDIVREWTDPKKRALRVSVLQLRQEFCERMNPAVQPPLWFDRDIRRLRDRLSNAIPPITVDRTPQQFFTRPFLLDDIEWAKEHLARRHTKASPGLDKVSYQTVVDIPNEALLALFNACIHSLDAPQDWFTTILVGVLKQGKPATSPDSYRLVGLECCLLKVLTLLIDRRLRAWADAYNILPDSQNGFREAYRTHNNSFILRTAIEKARFMGETLYVAFIDLKNAFPSTHLPTLWSRLFLAGVSGPLFDWLRMLYARMSYVLREHGSLTAAFKSMIGVLTGDTASPVLWNIYFANIGRWLEDEPVDVALAHRLVSHVEQADDVALFSTSLLALQRKVDGFLRWCDESYMTISAQKSKWMIMGPGSGHAALEILYVRGEAIELVSEYKYVGVWFTSTARDIFTQHYLEKASKACRVACASFALDSFIGALPPKEGKMLYMARVDPILTFGCEVVLDVEETLVQKLSDVQHLFIRRLLGLGPRSLLATLFTETGILPLRFRRAKLAIGYLIYLLRLPHSHYAYAALQESKSLLLAGFPCWLGDLNWVIGHLPGQISPISFHVENMSSEELQSLQDNLDRTCDRFLQDFVDSSPKCRLLRGRLETTENGHRRVHMTRKLRHYLSTPLVPAHRRAFTSIMLSTHALAVERLRYQERYRAPVPHAWRLCRFCGLEVEDEVHVLLKCDARSDLLALRALFRQDVARVIGDLPWTQDLLAVLVVLLHDQRLTVCMAKYIYVVLEIFGSAPIFIPSPYAYLPLDDA